MRLSANLWLLALPIAAVCQARDTPPSPASSAVPARYDEVGYATWYGEELAGAKTASGAPFRPSAITAAHRTLPLGSYVEVTALDTGRTILVLINDRGPGQRDRLIDLSRGAAALLGSGRRAKAAVRVRSVAAVEPDRLALARGDAAGARDVASPEMLASLRRRLPARDGAMAIALQATPQPSIKLQPHGNYVVQVASFVSGSRARSLAERLRGSADLHDGRHRVRLGPFDTAEAAQRARDDAARRGYGDASIIVQP